MVIGVIFKNNFKPIYLGTSLSRCLVQSESRLTLHGKSPDRLELPLRLLRPVSFWGSVRC